MPLNRPELLEDALRASEESYRTIFDASSDAIFVHDLATGAVLDANQAACRMSGLSHPELLARGIALIGSGPPPFTAELALEHMRRAAAGEPQHFEWCSTHAATGEALWVEVGLQRVAIAGVERLLATVRDIRDRKAADQALVASEEAYRTIFQHSSESIWVHDVATGEMLDVNAAGCELYGYTHDEMMRLGHDALLYPGSAYTVERVARYMAAAMAGETPRFEWLGRHRDGSEVWGEVTLRRVTVGGKDRILATVRDIKDRKRVEAVLREANEQLERRVAERTAALEEANAALEAEIAEREAAERALREAIAAAEAATRARELILSAVAHDLRNPLASIAMDAEMTRHLISADAQPAQYRAVSRIERTAQRMGRLIDDLLDVSRLEHGSFAVHLQTLAPDTVFIEADAMLQPLARSRSIRLEFAGPAGLPVITADGERLLQVFSNLVGNALKFTPAGGAVRVTWSAVDGELVVAIADSGSGIAAENLPNVFTAFWRETHGAAERGLGLGLVITRAIVEAHGGRIRIESTAGAGTTVHFAIPFAAAGRRARVD